MIIDIPEKDPSALRQKLHPTYRKVYPKLRKYVEMILSKYKLTPQKVTLWRKGVSSFVLKLEFTGKKDLVIKIAPRYGLIKEIYFFKKAKQHGFPVPKVIAVDLSRKFIPCDFYIGEWVVGVAPDELNDKELYQAAFELGKVFTKLNKIRADGFGAPTSDKHWSYKSWRPALRDFIYREVSFVNIKKFFGAKIATMVDDIMNDPKMAIPYPSLIHGDAGEDQFVAEKKNHKWIIHGILDPSDCVGGDPMVDIAGALISWNKKSYRKGFYDGYISVHKLSVGERYRLDRILFLTQVWASSLIYNVRKRDGKKMAREAVLLAEKFSVL